MGRVHWAEWAAIASLLLWVLFLGADLRAETRARQKDTKDLLGYINRLTDVAERHTEMIRSLAGVKP